MVGQWILNGNTVIFPHLVMSQLGKTPKAFKNVYGYLCSDIILVIF